MITRDEAFALVRDKIPSENLVHHSVATEIIMEALGKRLGLDPEDVSRWAITGLLHDLDYAETGEDPEKHGLSTVRELEGRIDAEMSHAILAHADKVPIETSMDKAICCADPTTGFITAAALVRPDKSLANVELKSLKKRWKEKAFARGASREQMAGHEALGFERDEFLTIALDAMKARAGELGL